MVLRFVACVLALSACDAVFGLSTKDVEDQACGPYGPAQPLQFGTGLQSPHNFSIGSDATHGSVVQSIGPSPVVTAIALGGDGIWDVDATRNAGLPVAPNAGRIVTDGDLYATETSDTTRLDERTFVASNSQWATDGLVMTDPRFDLDVGNVVTQVDGSDGTPQNHFGVVLERTQDATQVASTLLVIRRVQPFTQTQWILDTGIVAPLTSDSSLVEIGQGVVTLDHHSIIYAASYAQGGDLDLYISEFDREGSAFPTGTLLDSVSEPGVDDSAPSIDATCSTIFFERGGHTFEAVSEGSGT